MKSAYEIAMERLEKEAGPTRKLTDEQRKQIAEINNKYEAKIAEQKLKIESEIATAASVQERNQLQAKLTQVVAELEQAREKEKDAVWNAE